MIHLIWVLLLLLGKHMNDRHTLAGATYSCFFFLLLLHPLKHLRSSNLLVTWEH